MANAKEAFEMLEVIRDDEHEEIPKTEEEQKFEELESAINSNDGQGFLNIHQKNGVGNYEFVDRLEGDKMDFGQILKFLRDNYGGGEFRFMLYKKGRVTANKLITIKKPIVQEQKSNQNSDVMSLVLQSIEKQNERIERALSNSNNSKSTADVLKELALMKEVLGGNNQQNNSLKELVETMAVFKELGLINNGGSNNDSDSGLDKLMEMGGRLIEGATLKNSEPRKPNPAPQITNQQISDVKRQQMLAQQFKQKQMQQVKQNEDKQMLSMIKLGISTLCNYAAQAKDPYECVDLIFNTLPENKIREFLTAPDSMQKLIELHSDVQKYLPWFQMLAECVKYELGMPSALDEYANEAPAAERDESLHDFPVSPPPQSNSEAIRAHVGDYLQVQDNGAIVGDKSPEWETLTNADDESEEKRP